MNLRELNYILKVAELRSVTGAANALHISQPALSRYIHDVEKELGAKIFDRSTNTISLTYAGIDTEIFTSSGKKLRGALKDGRIDILILPDTWPDDPYNFESRLIYVEELVLAAKAGTIHDEFCGETRKYIKPYIAMEFSSNITCYRR